LLGDGALGVGFREVEVFGISRSGLCRLYGRTGKSLVAFRRLLVKTGFPDSRLLGISDSSVAYFLASRFCRVQITDQLADPDPRSELDLREPPLRLVVVVRLAIRLQRLSLVVISRTSSMRAHCSSNVCISL
jgi:hypothetical protein